MTTSTRFIVTGGAGFIGSNLALALNARGHHDIILVDSADSPGKQRNIDALRYREIMDKSHFREAFLEGDILFHALIDFMFILTTSLDGEFSLHYLLRAQKSVLKNPCSKTRAQKQKEELFGFLDSSLTYNSLILSKQTAIVDRLILPLY